MSIDVAHAVADLLGPDVVRSAALLVGEDEPQTRAALESAVPIALAGLIDTARSTAGPPLDEWLERAGPGPSTEDVTGLFAGGAPTQAAIAAGQEILANLFGPRLRRVSSLLSRTSGVRAPSAVVLLSLVVALVLAVLRREVPSEAPRAPSVHALLEAQRKTVADLAPPGLSSAMGVPSLTGLGSRRVASGRVTPSVRSPLRWVAPILALAILLTALASYIKS
jgi:Bacterial protein of unknown function (DUF937)